MNTKNTDPAKIVSHSIVVPAPAQAIFEIGRAHV